LKVLLADTDTERARIVEAHFAASGAIDIVHPNTGENLADAALRHAPDVVLVDMARPDRDSLEGIRQVAQGPHAIVLFVDHDDPDFMEEAISAGVSSYNVVGTELPDVKPIVKSAVALFKRYRRMAEDLHHAERALQERAMIEQAKSLLIKQRKMTEPEAHRWLQRQAMNRGKRIADVATDLVATGTDAIRDNRGTP
jgi:response regulator NasT